MDDRTGEIESDLQRRAVARVLSVLLAVVVGLVALAYSLQQLAIAVQ